MTAAAATLTHPAPHLVVVSLDVSSLSTSSDFYLDRLGFREISAERRGLIFESCTLASPEYPGFHLRLRAAFGRRPIGSSGGMLSLALRCPQDILSVRIASLAGRVRWIGPAPTAQSPQGPVRFADPDGYIIELFA